MIIFDAECKTSATGKRFCFSFAVGTAISFDAPTDNGVIAETIGGAGYSHSERRDTLSTIAFECIKG